LKINTITHRNVALTTRPFVITGAAFAVLLGLNEAGLFDVHEGKNPVTRYMAARIPSNESILEENLDRIEVVKEEAADYRMRMSAKADTFKPMKNPGYV